MQRTAEVQRRQLRHPSETRCQRCCPSCFDVIACTHRRPSARPAQAPPPATAYRPAALAHSTQHHDDIAGARKHPLTAQAQPMARGVPPRSSDVSCVILPRLGASDAAPAASMSLSARTAAPRLAPRKPQTTRYSPERHHPTRNTHHPCTAGGRKHPLTAPAAADARSVQLRSSDVSCVILPRLGASDAAPAASM